MAQSVERRIGSAEVTGPIPVSSSYFLTKNLVNYLFARFFYTQKEVVTDRLNAKIVVQ